MTRRRTLAAAAAIIATASVSFAFGEASPVAADPDGHVDHVTLELVADPNDVAAGNSVASDPEVADAIAAHGGTVIGQAPGVTLVSVPTASVPGMAATLDLEVRVPLPVDVRPQGAAADHPGSPSRLTQSGPTINEAVAITNAASWHAAGLDGTGIKIGVIDFFDVAEYWDEAEHGPTPVAGVSAKCFSLGNDCSDEFFDGIDQGGEDHGVAVVEIVRDMAPGATIYLGQARTLTDYYELIDWFADQGVTILNRSIGSRYDGPGDGRGDIDDLAAYAIDRGMLWVNSGGNNGNGRYYRHAVRLIGDQVAFGPSGSDTYLRFNKCIALGGIRWANDWDVPAAVRSDYDAYVWSSPPGDPESGSIVAQSTRSQQAGSSPLEYIAGTLCPSAADEALYLELRYNGGDTAGDVIEILDYGAGMTDYTQVQYSASTSVVDSKQAGVVAVGAIDPPASGAIAIYGSQGPTNDGRIAPALTAPSNLASTIFGSFAGTSASAPVVAGGAALLAHAGLATEPASLGGLLRSTTVDRGAAGPDDVFGHGEFVLPDPPTTDGGIDDTSSRYVPLAVPTRVLDTRPESSIGPPDAIGDRRQGKIVRLPVAGEHGLPSSGVTAVVVNVTSVAPDSPSFVQALPTLQAQIGSYSNVNVDAAGQVRANLAIVPVGSDGSISLYGSAAGDLVVDLLGSFRIQPSPSAEGRFVELDVPQRLVDSRLDGGGPLTSGSPRRVPAPSGVDPDEIGALVITVTATEATAPGWLQAYPTAEPSVIARTSTVNFDTAGTVANMAIVPADAGDVSVAGHIADGGTTHVVVDAIGYITSAAAPTAGSGRFVAVRPARAFDSRSTSTGLLDGATVEIDGSSASGVEIPDSASGVVWNIAIVGAQRPGFVRAWATGQAEPATSALNWTGIGATRAAATITAVDAGTATFRVEDGSANLPAPVGGFVADVFGYFT